MSGQENKLKIDALFESEERLRLALEATSEGLWDWDLVSGVVFRSMRYYQIVDRQSSESTSDFEFFKSTIFPDDLPLVLAHIEAHKLGKTPGIEIDYRLASNTENIKWIRTKGRAVKRDSNGLALRIVGTLSDVTKLKVETDQNKFRARLLDAVGQAVISTDIQGAITYINHAAETLYGWPIEEAIGRNILDITVPHISKEQAVEIMKDLLEGHEWSGEFFVHNRTGNVFLAEIIDTPMLDEAGKLIGVIGVSTDITERKEAEEQFRLVIESAANAMIIVNEKSVITLVNSETCIMFGYLKDELIGHSVNILLPDEYHQAHTAQVSGFIHTSTERRKMGKGRELYGQHKNGKKIPIEVGLSPFQSSKGRFVLATVIDISERKQQEKESLLMREQLSQASKMESIGQLTAGIAHDFNNILGAIMGYSELSQHMLNTGKADAIGAYQEEILKSGKRAKDLIRQMLTFSRLSPDENGGKAPVNEIKVIIQEVVSLLKPSIPSSINLHYWEESEQLYARILPVHLHQILLNLVINARDALHETGSIDVFLTRHHSDKELCSSCKTPFSGDFVQISVRDNGSGIPEETIHKMFDPFFTTKGIGKGTGMGLSVVHGLVHAQGGHIIVESSPDRGTTFSILLPIELAENCTVEIMETPSISNIKGIRIMVVDDEHMLANMLKEFLTAQGAQVTAFTNPQKALDEFSLKPENVDLVITDETMPGMAGMTLAKKLLAIKQNLPIILCTGYSEHATVESVEQIGIAGFFHKPINMNDLMLKIQLLWQAKA